MIDTISINRMFLLMAREAASTKSGEIVTGLPRPVLDRLATMSFEEIEAIARRASVSLITLRLSEADLIRLASLKDDEKGRSYALSMACTERRDG